MVSGVLVKISMSVVLAGSDGLRIPTVELARQPPVVESIESGSWHVYGADSNRTFPVTATASGGSSRSSSIPHSSRASYWSLVSASRLPLLIVLHPCCGGGRDGLLEGR
jgi:hypothetical protein